MIYNKYHKYAITEHLYWSHHGFRQLNRARDNHLYMKVGAPYIPECIDPLRFIVFATHEVTLTCFNLLVFQNSQLQSTLQHLGNKVYPSLGMIINHFRKPPLPEMVERAFVKVL